MDPEITEFARSHQAFQEAMTRAAGSAGRVLTPVGEQVQEFLGVQLGEVEPITESFLPHQTIDVDWPCRPCWPSTAGRAWGSADRTGHRPTALRNI